MVGVAAFIQNKHDMTRLEGKMCELYDALKSKTTKSMKLYFINLEKFIHGYTENGIQENTWSCKSDQVFKTKVTKIIAKNIFSCLRQV